MQQTCFTSRSARWRWALLPALVLAACSQDVQTPVEQPDATTPPGVIMPVDAGVNEYNLIDRTDPNGGPLCTVLNLCVLEINGAFWEHPVDANVGTGNLNPFWDTHNSPTSECFNTDAALPLDCARSAWTNALPLQVVPVFFFDPPGAAPPVLVRELVWDMNEPNSSPQTAQVSIDFFRVYLCAQVPAPPAPPPPLTVNPALFSTTTQVTNNCDRVYDIEVGGISSGTEGTGLAWDGSTQGSGNSLDYRILIPETLFEAQANTEACPYDPTGPNCGLFVIVWAHLGGKTGTGVNANVNWQTSGGFEEMSTVERPVPARKSGVKFHDLDADGVKDAGEPGLAGWTIFVETINHNGVLDAGEPFDVTDATGAYQINAIIAGTWNVHEVPQAGWTCSFPATTDTHGCTYSEVFEDGDVLTGNDFGNWTPATKSGVKFNDLDADGVKDAGEPGLTGWTIYVDYDDDGVADAGEPSAVTGAGGAYTITGINPGTWKVKEVLQTGWTCSFPAVAPNCFHQETFESDEDLTGNDFGNWTPATKAGTKFHDLDADGAAQEAGEPGLAGWTIFVDYDDDGVLDAGEPSDVTDASGDYLIEGINPGTWKVKEVLQTGWTCSYPAVAPNCFHQETFESDEDLTDNDFGNWTPASKAGVKFEDLDGDGADQEAGEPGLAGWTIYVDYDDDGVVDAGEPSDVTDATGAYLIEGINPGTWKVKEVLQAGWSCTFPNPCYHQETFESDEDLTNNNFGNSTTATKAGTKFHDLDADGAAQEAGEPGLAGWTIFVDYDDDGAVDAGEPSDVTDASGDYLITGIVPGTWKVKEVAQAGWTCSYPGAGAACVHQETFQSGDELTDNDFGNWTTATKAGTKFSDLDNDGAAQEAGEPGLAGWTIFVDYDDDGVLDAGEPSDVTDANGDYQITGINPGTWKVREVLQAGWTCTFPATTDAFGCYHQETFESDEDLTDNDFGNHFPIVVETETAYARGTNGNTCFTDLGISSNWGWGITFLKSDLPETFDVYAGAGQCDITGLTPIGTVTVFIDGSLIKVTINITTGTLESAHVFISSTLPFPSPVSPGQFPFKNDDPASNTITISTISSAGASTTLYRFIAHMVVSGLP